MGRDRQIHVQPGGCPCHRVPGAGGAHTRSPNSGSRFVGCHGLQLQCPPKLWVCASSVRSRPHLQGVVLCVFCLSTWGQQGKMARPVLEHRAPLEIWRVLELLPRGTSPIASPLGHSCGFVCPMLRAGDVIRWTHVVPAAMRRQRR